MIDSTTCIVHNYFYFCFQLNEEKNKIEKEKRGEKKVRGNS